MSRFRSVREAKEYLIGRILAQAEEDGVALSDVERKMLYFTETGWTLPDMKEVSAEFDRVDSQDEYEDKIAQLIRSLRGQQNERAGHDWDDAVSVLRSEDHYLLVLIDAAGQRRAATPGGSARLLVAAVAGAVCALVGANYLAFRLHLNSSSIRLAIDMAITVLAGVFLFLRTVRRR